MDTRQSSPVGGAAFRDAFGGAFSWCKVCKKHLAMATCGAGWCAQCYASAAQGSIMLTLAVHDAAGCKCRGRGAQTGSLLSPPGAASSATTPPGAYAQALGAAALPQATRVAFGQCQYLVFAGLSKDGRRQKRPRTTRVQSSASLVACPHVEPAVVRWAATPSGPVFACCCDRRSLAQFEVLASGGTAEDLEQLDNGFTSCLHIDHAREALRGTCIGAKAVAFTPQGDDTHPVTLAQCGEEHKRHVWRLVRIPVRPNTAPGRPGKLGGAGRGRPPPGARPGMLARRTGPQVPPKVAAAGQSACFQGAF